MKIYIFAPHPDDELVGAGGSIIKWMDEGHDVHIIYVSDGRAAYTFERKMGRLVETEATQISQDDLAGLRMREIDEVREFLGIPEEKIHKLMLRDQDVKNQIALGIEKGKELIEDADRIVLPSKNSVHEDHNATYEIATQAAKKAGLDDAEFFVYTLYIDNKAPKDKRVKIKVKNYRERAHEALLLYKSQQYIKTVRKSYEWVKGRKYEKFGVFYLSDLGEYYNF
jgi:LmbE family N-acetylglucosaminyl deacetylase